MSDDFFLSGEGPQTSHPDKEAFAAPSREGKCREAIYRDVEQANGEVVFVRDMELKYLGTFKSSLIYRAARDLVRSGLVKRCDTLREGKRCVGLVYCDPWKAVKADYVSAPKIYRKKLAT